MLKIVYLRPRRDWAPTIVDINRAIRAAVRLRRALWALVDQDAEYVGFEGDTLSGVLTRLLRPLVSATASRISLECGPGGSSSGAGEIYYQWRAGSR